jgi:chorismate synthase
LTAILEGIPAGLELSEKEIEQDLKRRQRGYGRGGRMQIENDRAQILSGVRYGKTLGSPIAFLLENKDWPNWTEKMSVVGVENPVPPLQVPRPGHADFAGMVKYRQNDLRNILERSSARETAMRVAAGAVAKKLLAEFGVKILEHVTQIGKAASSHTALAFLIGKRAHDAAAQLEWETLMQRAEQSPVACADEVVAGRMMTLIDEAKKRGDTLGGMFEIVATGVPVGLGSHVHWDRRLDSQVAQAMMSINAIKSVEIGLGKMAGEIHGSELQDQIFYEEKIGYYRSSNNAGGIEGGMTNGEPIVVRLTMKPLSTLSQPLQSTDVNTHEPKEAFSERSDVCAVPAAAVVGEAMLAIVLANALCEKLGGDSITEMQKRFQELPHAPLDR